MGKLRAVAQTVKGNSKSPWKPPHEREQEYEGKRFAVLQAAAELFVTRGFHGTTLTDVAARLHVTKPAIYYYFSSKDEILVECTKLGLGAAVAFLDENERSPGTGRDRLGRFMVWYAENTTTPFGMCLMRVAEQDVEEETQRQLQSAKRVIYTRLRQLVEAGIADGSVAPCDSRVAAFTIAGAVGWPSHWFRPGGPLTAREAAERVAEMLLAGLTPRA